MKRAFNKVWIALLAVAAFMVGACCSSRNSAEIKEVKARIAELKERLSEREMACVYGPPEIIERFGKETTEMRQELDSLEKELNRLKKCR